MMDGLCTNELKQKLTTLRRAPPPKPPDDIKEDKQNGAEFFKLKLKPTVRPVENNTNNDKDKVNNESEDNIANNNEKTKTRSSSIKKLSQAFENGSPGKPIIPTGKPTVSNKKPPLLSVKPTVSSKPPVSPNKHTRQSVLIKPDPRILDVNKETKIPDISPLPPLSSLGDPPQKPPKFGQLKPSLNKYLGTSYPSRPVPVVAEKFSKEKPASDVTGKTPPPVQDAPPIPKKPAARPDSVNKESENEDKADEIESEDFYDDTGVPAPSDEIYDDTVNSSEPTEDFYDDTGIANNDQDETFGEDIYEPIQEQQNQQRITPPSPPAKDGKEEKKKKEKERKKKEKEEKEEKEREEKERKKKEKEKERKVHEMKKRFSVKGTEKSLGTCRAAEDIPGNKMDIAASIGEEFDIIRKGKPIPDNKWLVKNKQGLYGFIDINKIEREADEDAEDLYEEVPASKMWSSQSSNGNHGSTPPVSSPPPPPSQSAPRPPTGNQDIYDDVAEQPDEELYEFLPEN